MKKIEIIWREILEAGVKHPVFEQKKLAEQFGMSTSTVFSALSPLRELGAVVVTGRNFRLTNAEKLLYFWATHRNLSRDIIYATRAPFSVAEIEGLMDAHAVYGCYSAVRIHLGSAPADYDKVYVYGTEALKVRFPKAPGPANLFVLRPDPYLTGNVTPVSQTLVDLWNLSDWYATDYFRALKEHAYGFL